MSNLTQLDNYKRTADEQAAAARMVEIARLDAIIANHKVTAQETHKRKSEMLVGLREALIDARKGCVDTEYYNAIMRQFNRLQRESEES